MSSFSVGKGLNFDFKIIITIITNINNALSLATLWTQKVIEKLNMILR